MFTVEQESPASKAVVTPDRQQAQMFSRIVLDDEATEFRCVHPQTNKVRSFWGSLSSEGLFRALVATNFEGYGIFAIINRLDASVEQRIKEHKAARDEDVTGIRALFVDIDRAEDESGENLRKLQAAPLKPNLITRTSRPHKLQAYWRVDGVGVAEFKMLQTALIKHFNADPSRTNPSSGMRVPGFLHTKSAPVLCSIVEVNA